MRTLVALAAIFCLCLAQFAYAEQRMFIIGADIDGYGVDRCLAAGQKCGEAAANAYCRGQRFTLASSYRKVDRGDVTGAIPAVATCQGGRCENLVAIVCAR
jgi:hypothetical protein